MTGKIRSGWIYAVIFSLSLSACSSNGSSAVTPPAGPISVQSITHQATALGELRHIVAVVKKNGQTLTLNADEELTISANRRTIQTTATFADKQYKVTYEQNLITNQTTIEYDDALGRPSQKVVNGLVGYVSDQELTASISRVSQQHAIRSTSSSRSAKFLPLNGFCGAACLEFLLVEGIGYLVCYALCIWLGDVSPN